MKYIASVAVVGQGYVGFPLAIRIAEQRIVCYGLDSSSKLVNKLQTGNVNNSDLHHKSIKKTIQRGFYKPTTNYSVIAGSQVVLICLPTPLTANGKPDLKILHASLDKIKKIVRPKTLIILESTVNPEIGRAHV